MYELNIKLNTEVINKDNKSNEIILGDISEKINKLRVNTVNVCKSMEKLKKELNGIKNLDKFDINLIGEKFNFDKNYLIKMKSELNFLKEGFIKYYFNIENDQTPFLLKASQKSKITNDKDPFIHLVPLDQELKDKIAECTYYIYQELISYQSQKVHNKILRTISPLKRVINSKNEDDSKIFGEKDENINRGDINININNKINMLINRNPGNGNYINMSEDNINNKFGASHLEQINKNNKILNNQNNNLYFRKYGFLNNKNDLNEENNKKILNDVNNKKEEPTTIKIESNNKEIKDNLIDEDKIKSKGDNSLIVNNINSKDEKRNLSEQLPNNNEYKNIFSKYIKNDLPINKSKNNSEIQKIKIINKFEGLNPRNGKIPNILPDNSKKDNSEENKIHTSDFDDLIQ